MALPLSAVVGIKSGWPTILSVGSPLVASWYFVPALNWLAKAWPGFVAPSYICCIMVGELPVKQGVILTFTCLFEPPIQKTLGAFTGSGINQPWS